jgi:type IV fimbrial biogenesis protein FimT
MRPCSPAIDVTPPERALSATHGVAGRGFTIVEMLVVITLIGILSVAASPVFINIMRDRRINRAAMHVADMYRTARTRALGRGMPVLIRWDANAGQQKGSAGVLTIVEPRVAALADVGTNCTSVNWNDAAVVYQHMRFDVGNGLHERANLTFVDDTGVTFPQSDICFSPRGRTFIRRGGILAELAGVPTFDVVNSGTGLRRTVFIPPNGVARLAQ